MRSKLFIFVVVWLAVIIVSVLFPAHAADRSRVSGQHINLDLITQYKPVEIGQSSYLGIRISLEEDWHIYWKNPGDTGLPTQVEWFLPEGFTVGPTLWPSPSQFKLDNFVNFGYDQTVIFPFRFSVSGDVVPGIYPVSAKVSWLICKDLCIPGDAVLSTDIEVDASGVMTAQASTIDRVIHTLPKQAADDWFEVTVSEDQQWSIDLSRLEKAIVSAEFFPAFPGLIEYQATQMLGDIGSGLVLRGQLSMDYAKLKNSFEGTLVLTDKMSEDVFSFDIRRTARPMSTLEPLSVISKEREALSNLWLAIGFALIGGVILNFMPCVLPVIAIKLMSLIGLDERSRAQHYQETGLFALGVILTFCLIGAILLALRSLGEQVGWGFQLQDPVTVLVLIVLFFMLALNMSGLFEVGTSLQGVGGTAKNFGRLSSFFSGVLVTVIATPCTAPFMGAAIGFSIAQGATESMLTFMALGIGMAAPFVLISLRPSLLAWLPKPGEWMNTLKNLLSVPLYLTVIWLIWVLGQQTNIHVVSKVLFVLVFIALCGWAIGKVQYRKIIRLATWRILIVISLLIAIVGLSNIVSSFGRVTSQQIITNGTWLPWSSSQVSEDRKMGRAVFVDYTAAWCITCQVNKKLVLNDPAVIAAFEKNNVITYRADWTSRDAEITNSLSTFGRSGVPVYVYYPPNQKPPLVLSEILNDEDIFELFEY